MFFAYMCAIVMIMLIYLTGFIVATIVLEWLAYQGYMWRWHKAIGVILILLLPAASGALLTAQPDILTILITILTVARLFNLLRLVEARIPEQHLRHSASRASYYFGSVQAALALLVLRHIHVDNQQLVLIVAILQVVTASLLLLFTIRSLRKSRPSPLENHYADKELPTVSVLIPARNETSDLEACLYSIIASDYPKLEIVVLDDCSRDRTPDIIKGFAHDGVRFISGAEPDSSWLAKNYAYKHLAAAATGEVLLFCGVDTRFSRSTIRTLVTTMMNKNKQMISVMPKRMSGGIHEALIQPMRYWWELALPRRYFNRPPVLSTCWLITSDTLQKLGGFDGVKHAIIPEMLFARQLIRDDAYSFIRAEGDLELLTTKSWQAQRDTAIRVRYPQVHRRPELAILLACAELVLLFGPFMGIITGIIWHSAAIVCLSVIAIILLVITHVIIVGSSSPGHAPIALVNFPAVVLTEIILGLISMAKYEFSVVEWKGRNVCIPVMHVIPRLPKV
jgi:hypothetical protein